MNMDMDGLNGVTIFVTVAFTVTGVVGLTDATDSFTPAEGVLFLATALVVVLVSYSRSRNRDRNAS